MTLNAEKCHFLCFRKYTANETSIFKNSVMKNGKKILGVTIDNRCKSHIKALSNTASQKIGELSKLSKYLNNTEK